MQCTLADIARRAPRPVPWQEGENIPWHEPGFSARMLAEHLSQAHDAASRRAPIIDRQVAWIAQTVLGGHTTAILDLGCGPGLYTSRLARLGHSCVGIDFSPAAIAYATSQATALGLACRYQQADIREANFGSGFGLVLLLYGELNVFPRETAGQIIEKAYNALTAGGLLVLEPQRFAAIQHRGEQESTWYTRARGLFADSPYLCLTEHFWEPDPAVATTRYFIVDLATSVVTRHAQSFQAYTDVEYRDLLQAAGFATVALFPSLAGVPDPEQADFCAIVARK